MGRGVMIRIAFIKLGARVFIERDVLDTLIDTARVDPVPPWESPIKTKRPAGTRRSHERTATNIPKP
ncbi:MAG: hypothetical protein LC808_00505 [Actinobacteria bacterium]|nr:hypothetical protein [Actinomycetota bacterium]